MKDEHKTKKQLIAELAELRQQVAELRASETERKRMEKALRKSEERLKEVVEHMPMLFDAFDENGTALFWNKECERVTGYSSDEIMGDPKSLELVCPDPEYRAWVLEQLHELGSYYRDWELDVRCKNGETRTISWSNISRDHPIPGWWSWGIGVDVTERKRAEEALRESEARFREVLEHSQDALYKRNLETGRYEYMSPAIAKIIGYTPNEVMAMSPDEVDSLIHPEDIERISDLRRSVLEIPQGHEIVSQAEYRVECKDGSYRWISDHYALFRGPEGRLLFSIASVRDITERKWAEEELQWLYEQAQRDAEAKATLLHEINHRVKNNLSVIIGLLYAERRYAKMTDQATYRAITQRLTNRVNGLATVHSLLSASEWAPLLLSDLAGQVVRSYLQVLPRDKDVSVEVSPSPIRVTADQAHSLALMINELTTNTVKHTLQNRNAAHIAVGITCENNTVRFEFRDDGPGYPEDVLRLKRYSVGLDLIQNLVHQNLRGELSLHSDHGAVAVIRFKAQA